MTAPRHDQAGLEARIRATRAEIQALEVQARAIAKKRAARDAEMLQMAYQLARIPADDDVVAPVPRGLETVPIKQATRIANCGDGTLQRHGIAAGWCFKRGGRWYVDLAGLQAWMSGPRTLPLARV
ncbi:hypothetical protein [Methylobacterium sp. J-090]|uniref:hypothetical protein n=1 Tax=Methylobacterium sp. J-090 TaxID=2836666 RepID=UPI001FBB54A4|nr:hypothetical protein [Methylobacterium sp. J-090]MCJ2083219.1 hypothetical protein [Methylobacterium sp. J-090]